jgi:thioesterase domain-containing protein
MQTHTLLVFLFHGVGGEHALNVSLQAHHQLIAFLKENIKQIWIAPLIDIARYVKKHQQTITTSND